MSTNIYILKLQGGNYYVGKSDDPMKRYQEHLNCFGSAWTKKYKPISVEKIIENASPFDEDRYVKEYMSKHGIEKVRGGAYTLINLTEEQENVLRNELRATTDKCMKCGKAGHFAKYCTRKSSFTGKCQCGKTFLDFKEYHTHIRMCLPKNKEEEVWQCDYCDRTFTSRFGCSVHEKTCQKITSTKKQSGACFRCGRTGHYSSDCYARTNKNGQYIDSDDDSD